MPIYRDIYDGPPRWYGAQRTTKRYIAIHCTVSTGGRVGPAVRGWW